MTVLAYKAAIWLTAESAVRQSSASKDVSMEAEEATMYQKIGENTGDWRDLVHAVANCRACELVIALQWLAVEILSVP
jgi:hypothetical protein